MLLLMSIVVTSIIGTNLSWKLMGRVLSLRRFEASNLYGMIAGTDTQFVMGGIVDEVHRNGEPLVHCYPLLSGAILQK